ncbi:MAG: deoxyguanosinetriphosphate triphosphohydrolase [Deltaproteobacteria bacterium]|nr:deoxyguanosinetriphosphate triphosphohydrolase [Deltaproteobacteria bacterium]
MRTRETLELLEKQTLLPYATVCPESQGRLYPEKEHPYRTAFQRDRDRIVHTSAFRRLEYKTQVFVNHEGDYYRTRLTHSLEVSQIGRTMARALGVNENLTESICLAHDLGHTPFGHSGQDVIKTLMKQYGGFEHNKQSFRIVTKLEKPYPYFPGLNLTYEVLEGITKHASEYDMPDGSLFIKTGYPTIEAQIANFADEIAYNNHDLDDGLQSGLICFDDLKSVSIWQNTYKRIAGEYANLSQKQIRRLMIRAIIGFFVTDVMNNTQKQIEELNIKTLTDVRKQGKNLVMYSDEATAMNIELKKFLFEKLYRHYRVERMAEKAKKVLTELFNTYMNNPNIIPPDFKDSYEEGEPVERIVCDYIAGMTDRYALDEYSKLFDPHAKV